MITLKVIITSEDRQPIDTLIAVKSIQDYIENRVKYKQYALHKIIISKGWRYSDLTKYGYNKISVKYHDKQIY